MYGHISNNRGAFESVSLCIMIYNEFLLSLFLIYLQYFVIKFQIIRIAYNFHVQEYI